MTDETRAEVSHHLQGIIDALKDEVSGIVMRHLKGLLACLKNKR